MILKLVCLAFAFESPCVSVQMGLFQFSMDYCIYTLSVARSAPFIQSTSELSKGPYLLWQMFNVDGWFHMCLKLNLAHETISSGGGRGGGGRVLSQSSSSLWVGENKHSAGPPHSPQSQPSPRFSWHFPKHQALSSLWENGLDFSLLSSKLEQGVLGPCTPNS